MKWTRALLVALLVTGSAVTMQSGIGQDRDPDPIATDAYLPVSAPVPVAPAMPVVDTALLELGAELLIPVQGIAASDLRDNFHQDRGERRHDAIDILAPHETPVLSATAGRVLHLAENDRGGLMVFTTDARERFVMLYAHLDDYADGLEAGMPLARGQLLGYVGSSGNAERDTPHLHFAIKRVDGGPRWSRGTAVNPYPLLKQPSHLAGGLGKRVAEQAY